MTEVGLKVPELNDFSGFRETFNQPGLKGRSAFSG
jgi:hypothetical protein